MALFTGIVFLHCKRKVKEKCCKPKAKKPVTPVTEKAESEAKMESRPQTHPSLADLSVIGEVKEEGSLNDLES